MSQRVSGYGPITKHFNSAPTPITWIYTNYTSTNGTTKVLTPVNTKDILVKNVYYSGSLTSTSDIKLKTNINKITNALTDKLCKLNPVEFTYKDEADTNKTHYGLIAQDVEKIYPKLVTTVLNNFNNDNKDIKDNEDAYKYVNYTELIPILICKIQQMDKEIAELKEKIK